MSSVCLVAVVEGDHVSFPEPSKYNHMAFVATAGNHHKWLGMLCYLKAGHEGPHECHCKCKGTWGGTPVEAPTPFATVTL